MLEASGWGKWLSHKGKVLVRLLGRGCCGPQADTTPRGVTHPRKMASEVENSDSAQGSWCLSLQLSRQKHKPQTSHATLICSTPPSQEPRVSGCEWNFVCQPLKRAPVSLVDSHLSLMNRTTNFHSQMLCEHLFLAMVLWTGSPAWSKTSATAHKSRASPFYDSVLPTSFDITSVNPWL